MKNHLQITKTILLISLKSISNINTVRLWPKSLRNTNVHYFIICALNISFSLDVLQKRVLIYQGTLPVDISDSVWMLSGVLRINY